MQALEGKCISASFGVTEVQSGDTPETMLPALGPGPVSSQGQRPQHGRAARLRHCRRRRCPQRRPAGSVAAVGCRPRLVLERTLATSVPFNIVVEKMRGFVADHHAQIDHISEDYLVLTIEGHNGPNARRVSDRPVPFVIEMRFEECDSRRDQNQAAHSLVRTIIHVTIRPQRNRDRRRRDLLERAQQLAASIKSYLVAQDHHPERLLIEDAESSQRS